MNQNDLFLEYNNIAKKYERIYSNMAKIFKLSDCTLWILYTLRTNEEKITQSEICNYSHQPKQTVNTALKKMESDGYIKLCYGSDHKSKQIEFTKKGIELCENTVDKIIAAECDTLLCLPEEELKAFLKLFRKYTKLLQQNMNKKIDCKKEGD